MNWDSFINKVVDLGIAAAKRDYTRPDQQALLAGSLAGFEACRNKSVSEITHLLQKAHEARSQVDIDVADNAWYARGFYNEIEWVCNVVSAALYNQNMPVIIQPTARGMQTAAHILGVSEDKKGAS